MRTTRDKNLLSPKASKVAPEPSWDNMVKRGTLTQKKSPKLVKPTELVYNSKNLAYRKYVKKHLKDDEK